MYCRCVIDNGVIINLNNQFCSILLPQLYENIVFSISIYNKTIIMSRNEWLHHLVLDVFKEEPLPTDSKLWEKSDKV